MFKGGGLNTSTPISTHWNDKIVSCGTDFPQISTDVTFGPKSSNVNTHK